MSVWEKVRRLINAQNFTRHFHRSWIVQSRVLSTQADGGFLLKYEHEPDGSDAQILLGGDLHSRHTFMEEHE